MPTCQNCGEKWTWKQTIKTILKLNCPYCGRRQYESASSRRRSGLFALIPLVLLPFNAWLDFSIGNALILPIVIAFLILVVYPFILKLSNEEEPFW
ncbi:TIGR04104 family putative zinc finger protein [Sediminibacillus massiliensis]|uniref:TIGR04104 family putative zinc finger protein n=1 Tax=Sediminibacillus massiliensis TaxID=1926277 RepID=UPI0009885106|nr:TIGR04104 family putative zinc finger protein [Sediminibacillus massiliensis]